MITIRIKAKNRLFSPSFQYQVGLVAQLDQWFHNTMMALGEDVSEVIVGNVLKVCRAKRESQVDFHSRAVQAVKEAVDAFS